MQFNRYIWDLYRASPEGQAAIERDVTEHWHTFANTQEMRQEVIFEGTLWVILIGGGIDDDTNYREIFINISGLSSGLHNAYPEFFTSYLFIKRFDHLKKICYFFGITLPDEPTKQQKCERALYYLEINRALQAFRHEHGLLPKELNAFLYDFAPKNIQLANINTLPEASRVWFSIGNSTVKAHFQGRSGSALSLEEYQSICGLIKQTDFDTALLPTAPSELTFGDLTLNNERDVETQLLEPLLLKLGFTPTDWVRQLPVRMGRGQRNYPDYVLGCDLKEKSYALRLQAQSLTLADARGIWIFQQRSDGFVFDAFTFKVWKELTHPDILHEISLIFGKKVIDDAVQSRLRTMKAPASQKVKRRA